MKTLLVKLAVLFSYCGGPLFLSDLLKPHLGVNWAFVITVLPVALMLFGTFHLEDDPRERLASIAVPLGRLGLYVALGMHAYALWRFAGGVRPYNLPLHGVGIAVGLIWSAHYLVSTRRWNRPAGGSGVDDASVGNPIEPS